MDGGHPRNDGRIRGRNSRAFQAESIVRKPRTHWRVEEPGAIAVGWQTMEVPSRLEMPATRLLGGYRGFDLPIKAG